jgi:ABC-type spermidine/putrescine transport system permease subunit I
LNVTLPLARPGIAAGVLLTAVPMTGEYVVPALLGGDKGVLMGGLIASQYLEVQNAPLGSAMAVLVLVVLGVMVALLTRATRGFDEVIA